MSSTISRVQEILEHDLDPEFVAEMAVAVGWAYADLHRRLAEMTGLTDCMRLEMFADQRSSAVVSAVAGVAKRRGVPFGFKRLSCNGQSKLLVKTGRLVFTQEPILTLGDAPRVADYKLELSEAYGLSRQLELDLGDVPGQLADWCGQVFAVLLHGSFGARFNERDRRLGALMLAVPSAEYDRWITRADFSEIAIEGAPVAAQTRKESASQSDRVVVSVRASRKIRRTGDE